MKNAKYILAALAVAVLSSCKPTPKEAGYFNDRLMEQQRQVVIKYDELLETFDTYVPSKMDAALIALSDQVAAARQNVIGIEPIAGGEALKLGVLEYLTAIDDATQDDFEYLVRLYKIPENEFTPELRIQWEERYKDVDKRLKDAAEHLKGVQAVFANDFHLNIAK